MSGIRGPRQIDPPGKRLRMLHPVPYSILNHPPKRDRCAGTNEIDPNVRLWSVTWFNGHALYEGTVYHHRQQGHAKGRHCDARCLKCGLHVHGSEIVDSWD